MNNNFLTIYNNVKFDDIWNIQLPENKKLLLEESLHYWEFKKSKPCIDLLINNYIICEDTYFNKIPEQFLNKFIELFKNLFKHNVDIATIDLFELLDLIQQDQVKNYRNFFDFIQLLITNKIGQVTLKINDETSSYQLPYFFNHLIKKVPNNDFFDSIKKKYQRGNQINNYLKIIKDNILSFDDFGTITINKDVFDDSVELEIQITHEVRHLLHFLVRLNLVCWNAFQHFSQIDFDNNISNKLLNVKKYFLDENEFITLSSTYIDRLIHIFKQYCRDDNYDEKKLLIQTILVLADIYPKTMLKDSYWADIIKNNSKTTDSIILFFKELFFNHKQQKIPGNSKSDKYVKLIKWTLNQFDI